jgi:short coiled-coil protein
LNFLDTTAGNSEEEEEKQRLIERVIELQSTLDDLSKKVTDVKEENLKLKSENTILGSYIENLMTSSNVFQSALQSSTKK